AIPLHEATLAQHEQVLGDMHPSTLASRDNLAASRQAAQAVHQGSAATTIVHSQSFEARQQRQ
ncbi:hypothetical protein, partial [Streptomyces sp. or20]|uniref:hypothetical protein n=1 Tax=Streptomyces sp. or20 TaxID=1828016 RepID=UPI001C54D8F8